MISLDGMRRFLIIANVSVTFMLPSLGCGVKGNPIPYVQAYPEQAPSPTPAPPKPVKK